MFSVFSCILLVFSPCFVCFLFSKCRTCTRGDWTAVTWLFLTTEIRRSKCSWIGRHENWILSKTLVWHNSSVLCSLSCVLVNTVTSSTCSTGKKVIKKGIRTTLGPWSDTVSDVFTLFVTSEQFISVAWTFLSMVRTTNCPVTLSNFLNW